MEASYNKMLTKLEAYQYLNEDDFKKKRDEVRHLLQSMDKNHNNELSASEFKELAKFFGVAMSDQEADECVKTIDKDGNNTIDVDELYDWWKQPFEQWSDKHGKLEWLRLKLRTTPLVETLNMKKIHRASTKALSGWSKLKGAIKVVQFYKTTWKKAPETREEMDKMRVDAEKEGKQILAVSFIRHGESTSNEGWDRLGREPWIFDAKLTERGIEQALQRGRELQAEGYSPELIVVSPLSRTLMTCDCVFSYLRGKCRFIVHPICREQVTGADDIGRHKEDLEREFAEEHFDFSLVPSRKFWWYIPEEYQTEQHDLPTHQQIYQGANNGKGWEEPGKVLASRCREFEKWLVESNHKEIAVVSHGDFIERMCGMDRDIENCERFILEVNPLQPLTVSEDD